MNNKKCIKSGVCFLSYQGENTKLVDSDGNLLKTGDLVVVFQNEDLECILMDDPSFIEKVKFQEIQTESPYVVVKNQYTTYTNNTVLQTNEDNGWIYGWLSINPKEYTFIKVKDYSQVEHGTKISNFKYENFDYDEIKFL